MQNFSSIGSVLVQAPRLEKNYKNNNNNDEHTDMYEHLDPLSEQGVQKLAIGQKPADLSILERIAQLCTELPRCAH